MISGRAARCTKALSPSRREQSVLRGQCLRQRLTLLTTLCQYAYWLESFIQGIAAPTVPIENRRHCSPRSVALPCAGATVAVAADRSLVRVADRT